MAGEEGFHEKVFDDSSGGGCGGPCCVTDVDALLDGSLVPIGITRKEMDVIFVEVMRFISRMLHDAKSKKTQSCLCCKGSVFLALVDLASLPMLRHWHQRKHDSISCH